MAADSLTLEDLPIMSADYFASRGYPFEAWALLREEAPVHWFDDGRGRPFWAITRYEDVVWISKQPRRFLNAPRLTVSTGIDELPVRTLLNMDPPEHQLHRRLLKGRFTPQALRRRMHEFDAVAERIVADLEARGTEGEIDFVREVSAVLPIAVIAKMLGVPEEDWNLLFDWTNESVGVGDPEYRREGESPSETAERARLALFEYFDKLAAERRSRPRDDLVSVLANAELDGEPLPVLDLLSYYFLLVVAGNETTRNATTGGLLALIENPDEFEKLRQHPELLPVAVEEMVRWTSPVIHFARTATEDVELRGQNIRAGDLLGLFYPAANRDEQVFEEPDRFRVDRKPNPHIAFGIGEHFCLGANVARMELLVAFRCLLARLERVELAGAPERLRSNVIGGIKHLPIRYRLWPAG